MARLIRGTVISRVAEVIAEAGGDPEAVLRAHGIDPAATSDFERFIVVDDAAAVVGDAARELGCPDLGMRLGLRQSVQILGPVGILLRNAVTVGDALEGVCRYIGNIAPIDTAELIRTPQAGIFSYDTSTRNDWNRQQMVEKSLTVAMGAFRSLLGDDFVPIRVTLRHRRMAAAKRYREVFGRPVDFECDRNAIHLPLRALSQPVPNRDTVALALAEGYLARIRPDLAMVAQVGEIARRLMIVGRANLVDVARAMSLHPRALERQLADESTTFEKVLDDVRRTAAWELSAARIPISQIARELGYSEQSSYSRACRRWFGESPRELRSHATTTVGHESVQAPTAR